MIGSRKIVTAASAVLLGVAAVGCQNKGGEVKSRTQDQEVRPDGTAVQTRSQVRETAGGSTVRETQTQTRKEISPGSGGTSGGSGGTSTGTGTSGTGTTGTGTSGGRSTTR